MTPEEATLFNLIRLVAQDHLLVSVKLPILQVVSVVDKDEEARKALMRSIQPVRLDVVLAHPGTLQATTVVKFQKNEQEQPEKRDHVVDTVLKAAGINVVVLHLNRDIFRGTYDDTFRTCRRRVRKLVLPAKRVRGVMMGRIAWKVVTPASMMWSVPASSS